jgi:uncharacterized membrane protein
MRGGSTAAAFGTAIDSLPKVRGNGVSKQKSGATPAKAASIPSRAEPSLTQDFVQGAATVGLIVAGVALFEVALVPGIVIGGAAVLAPSYLPKIGRRLRPLLRSAFAGRTEAAASAPGRTGGKVTYALPARANIKQAVVKTITYRIIVTSLDFSVNYVVIGELATAAGLSAFALVVAPLFYLGHEAAWNHFGATYRPLDITEFLPLRPNAKASWAARGGLTLSRAIAKTITFRTIASAMDFTTNYVVVGDLATAAVLSASGLILGPFVYFFHEKAWEHVGSSAMDLPQLPAPTDLLTV